MKSLISLGIIIFALSFCNLSETLKGLRGSSNSNSSTDLPENTSKDGTTEETEKAELSPEQKTILESGQQVTWEQQGIIWILPRGWKKMDVKKESFNYGSPDNAFLIGSISVMPDNFPSETSLKATYESSLSQLKNGKYEKVRYLEIDGIKGVEWTETMPEESDSPRRHQWIGFRNYQGQNQQLNIMLSTKGSNFEKHRDDFSAVMYSMKIAK
ncbi:MAG: hypothetical protein R2747_08395 [Pyrinomonadaceae bacterium]